MMLSCYLQVQLYLFICFSLLQSSGYGDCHSAVTEVDRRASQGLQVSRAPHSALTEVLVEVSRCCFHQLVCKVVFAGDVSVQLPTSLVSCLSWLLLAAQWAVSDLPYLFQLL